MKIFRLAIILVITIVVVGGFRWYRYVSNTESPYDEVGIELNSRLPQPLRKWGCDRLHTTFANTLPPYGCQSGTDTGSWL
jgi:hypothetical protein